MDLHYKLSTTGPSQMIAAAFKWAMGILVYWNPTQCYLPDSSGYLSITSSLNTHTLQEDTDTKGAQAYSWGWHLSQILRKGEENVVED